MKRLQLLHLATAALMTLSVPGAAFAQYVWFDEKGVKQYSDMPPPPSVPTSRIIKQSAQSAAEPPSAAITGTTTPAPREMTTAEKNAEFRKRRAEQAEKEKKAAAKSLKAAEKAKSCERARNYDNLLTSGERIVRTDKNGERSFLSDEQRNRELREVKRMLDACK
jgi:hypothetical protein